jgi:hypothetical protein
MRPTKSSGTGKAKRRTWEPPVVTKLTLAAQKQSGPGSGLAAAPQAPAAPASKLGFSFELSFPLSARTEQ